MESSNLFKDKAVLITGGTGSFGQAMAKRLLEEDLVHKVIIFSRDEWKQWEMAQNEPIFNHPKIRYFLGDVRDELRLRRAFREVQIVIHAAALKQVPAAEYNPSEFIKTNVVGAMNIINAALDSGVEKVMALSSDKAVNPVNLYGATKLCADKLFVAANAYTGVKGHPIFSVVRYGNVLASRGSIINLWQKLVNEGAQSIPVTDPRMTRFWITIEETVDFVVQSLNLMRGGEVFVPKIPSMRIVDLAEAVAPRKAHDICGIRAGEKLHELMIGSEDSRHTREYDNYYIIIPELYNQNPKLLDKFLNGRPGKKLPDGFAYTSDNNKDWLSVEDLRKLIASN